MLESLAFTPISQVVRSPMMLVSPETSIAVVVARMRDEHKSAVGVVDGFGRLMGLFSERDALMRLGHAAPVLGARAVGTLMARDVISLRATDSIRKALFLMQARDFRHLPIVDADGLPTAIVALRDILCYVADFFPREVMNLPPEPRLEAYALSGG